MNKRIETSQITDAKARYKAGVLKYVEIGYWQPDYRPKDIRASRVFRAPDGGAA